jgi:hypothetical protein
MWCATMAGTATAATATWGSREGSCCTTDEIETDVTERPDRNPGTPDSELIKVVPSTFARLIKKSLRGGSP